MSLAGGRSGFFLTASLRRLSASSGCRAISFSPAFSISSTLAAGVSVELTGPAGATPAARMTASAAAPPRHQFRYQRMDAPHRGLNDGGGSPRRLETVARHYAAGPPPR